MVHAAITIIFCVIIFFLKLPATLYFLPAVFYLGREIAQAEYRYIEEYCDHKRKNMPWYAIFLPKAWTLKGILDWVLPLVVSTIFYLSNTLIFL
jgi:hypothetical protein